MTAAADPGLQAERTALAWKRTALAVLVGSLVGLRLLPPALGALGYIGSVAGLAWSLELARTARRRHREADAALRGHSTAGRGVGVPAAIAVTMTVVLGIGVLGWLVSRHL